EKAVGRERQASTYQIAPVESLTMRSAVSIVLCLGLILLLLSLSAAQQPESPWFRDASKEYGPIGSGPPVLTDLDGDGFPDLICDGKIYKNDRGRRFIDVTKEAGVGGSGAAGVADISNDGLPDSYFCGGSGGAVPHPRPRPLRG